MYFLPMPAIFKLFSTGKSLPIVVTEQPKALGVKDVTPGGWWTFQRADDRFVVLDRTEPRISRIAEPLIVLSVAGFCLWMLPLPYLILSSGGVEFWDVVWSTILMTMFASMAYFFGRHSARALFFSIILRPKKQEVVFDREAGTVTLPPVSWGKPETIEFNKLKVGYAGSSSGGPHVVAFRETGDGAVDLTLGHGVGKDWSFYVWYMDKNRPLPPGTAFDPYRERDEARRRGLGARKFAHAADGIGNVLPLEGPIPEEVEQFLSYFEEVFGRFSQIEWVAFGGLVHHQTEHVDGLHLEVKTSNDVPLPNDIRAELNHSLMAALLSRLPHYRFLELAFTPRPRGRAIYSKSAADSRDAAEMD